MATAITKSQAEAVNSASLTAARLLTKRQAAEYLQTSTRYIERLVTSGRLRAYKPTGKLWRVRQSSLDRFLESGSTMEEAMP
jgi:excisionase family DNA binding protein